MITLALTTTGDRGRVELDGIDISHQISGVAIEAGPGYDRANRLPAVEIKLNATRLEAALERADVRVDDDTAALLVRLGWTPPKEITR